MPAKPDRLILDTNLWISLLLKQDYSRLDKLLEGRRQLLFSQELLAEFMRVAQRPKFRKYFSPTDLEDILDLIEEHAEFVEVTTISTACRDVKDNFLLALAIDGQADYLLTGDSDLLDLKNIGDTTISKIADYLVRRG